MLGISSHAPLGVGVRISGAQTGSQEMMVWWDAATNGTKPCRSVQDREDVEAPLSPEAIRRPRSTPGSRQERFAYRVASVVNERPSVDAAPKSRESEGRHRWPERLLTSRMFVSPPFTVQTYAAGKGLRWPPLRRGRMRVKLPSSYCRVPSKLTLDDLRSRAPRRTLSLVPTLHVSRGVSDRGFLKITLLVARLCLPIGEDDW
ncbi:hypothetical protein HIM_04575 [Hirsutella minnesotensis 3608]|uniref:Uncharacterized protein n=1 Tax=Hirsutella minnesotensis 3608 TaxID=1043627 RepID=A0A0F8A5Y1_9HYPO|nr:hypothetical protein HIM_04575 [Hirsutella minnesotensis 3608]